MIVKLGKFEVSDEIFSLIVQHLSGNFISGYELLKCSLVSKSFYSLIGQSKFFGQKIKIDINREMTDDDVKALQNSSRNYSSILVKTLEPGKEFELLKSKTWTNFELYWMKFATLKHLHDYLRPIAETMEILTLGYAEILQENYSEETKIDFPGLETLKIICCSPSIVRSFGRKHENLKKVYLELNSADSMNAVELINANPKLELLSINAATEFIKFYLPSVQNLTVKSLELFSSSWSETANQNYRNFLTSLGPTLEELEYRSGTSSEIFDVWNDLQCLRKLKIYTTADEILEETLKLKPNDKITQMIISWPFFYQPHPRDCPSKFVISLLSGAPNLEKLSLCVLDEEILQFSCENLKSLKELNYMEEKMKNDEVTTCEEIFGGLEKTSLNKYIKIVKIKEF